MTGQTERASRIKAAALILQASMQRSLQYPKVIHFREDLSSIFVTADSCADVEAWAPFFGIEVGDERNHPQIAGVFLYTSTPYGEQWEGWTVHVDGHDPHRSLGEVDEDETAALIAEAVQS